MKCVVCAATWADATVPTCPQCGYDMSRADAKEPSRLNDARDAFRHRTTTYAPQTRVGRWDVLRPWVAVGLGFLLFVVWLRACSTGGFF